MSVKFFDNAIEHTKEILYKRSRAYKRIFKVKNPDVELILRDLATFCCDNRPTYSVNKDGNIDPITMAAREGRREVFLRIAKYIDMDLTKLEENNNG